MFQHEQLGMLMRSRNYVNHRDIKHIVVEIHSELKPKQDKLRKLQTVWLTRSRKLLQKLKKTVHLPRPFPVHLSPHRLEYSKIKTGEQFRT